MVDSVWSDVMGINGKALRNIEDNWNCLTLYKASARQPGVRSIVRLWGLALDNIYAKGKMQQAPWGTRLDV